MKNQKRVADDLLYDKARRVEVGINCLNGISDERVLECRFFGQNESRSP